MSDYLPENPLIVQSDQTMLLEVHLPHAEAARDAIAPFAELIKSPEHVHTYRITPLSIWNARAAGLGTDVMIATLREYAKYPVPEGVAQEIQALGRRYGLAVIERDEIGLILRVADAPLAELLARDRQVAPLLGERVNGQVFRVRLGVRGLLKQALVAIGYPADDLAGYSAGQELPLRLRETTSGGEPFVVRDYQRAAAATFHQDGRAPGGSGVIVLPCGAGKTIVGMAVMALVQENTLILTTSQTSMEQWRRELLDKTDLPPDAIAEYSGQRKDTGPVTLATYQILTWRASREEEFVHFGLFHARSWGLIIYDEVHLLPAPVFRITAELQSRRRLGLTATLMRQEEAQRLGRVLRPKKDGRRARFYTLVSLRTCEEDFARHRQLFLTEQGYSYRIEFGPAAR